ncbi:MAG: FAD-dependent oxidoreductase, partial [Nitrospirota bacterium]|nr:FAD-dependent oxidoreductase [Nitrospirota bacterium]
IDIKKKEITTSRGSSIKYDRLLLATGGLSFVPPIPGAGKKGVFTLRTLKDAIAIREYNEKLSHNTLIIGGGVLGLEAGYGLMRTGRHNITVVEFFSRLLPRQMDPVGSEILERQMKKMGFSFYPGAKSREITGRDKAEALIMEDGSTIECDMIIISAGVRPNSALAQKLGLKIEKGLVVNDRMETGIPDIYAAGDLVQHNGICYGIWPAAEKQGETAGINMAGGNSVYQGTTISNTLKVADIDLVAAGDIDAEGEKESITVKDIDNFIYKKIVIGDNRITGVILYGDIREKKKILRAIESGMDISGIKEDLKKWNLEGL